MANFWSATCAYLDEEFDEPDVAADHDLCRAIMAGRCEVHPDVWSDQPALTVPPPRFRRNYEEVEPVYSRPVERPPRPKPWRPYPPKPRPRFEWVPPAFAYTRPSEPPEPPLPPRGEVQLTCDVCNRHRLGMTLRYRGDRAAKVAEIRALGHQHGWTCTDGVDRCPACSQVKVEWE